MSWLMKKDFNKTKKKCPFCNKELHVKGVKQYQNLIEHVSDPNAEPSYKNYYQCDCEDAKNGFWGDDGSPYGNMNYKKFKYLFNDWYHEYKSSLIGSYNRTYLKQQYFRNGLKYGLIIKKCWSIRYNIHKYFDNIKCNKRVDMDCELTDKNAILSMTVWALEHDFDLDDGYIESVKSSLTNRIQEGEVYTVEKVGKPAFPCRMYLITDGERRSVVKEYGLKFNG